MSVTPLKPNLFQRRWKWHERVVDFEKKFDAIHPPLLPPKLVRHNATQTLSQTLVPRNLSDDFEQATSYKNRLFCVKMRCGDTTEHLVSLMLDNSDDLYDDVEETKVFDTEQEAIACFHAMQHIKTMYPCCAMDVFKNY
jgi:hypothetical protein